MFKKGSTCPNGLQEGFVYWDDETIDNKNYDDGDLPEGVYTDKTKILFCCSVTGKAESEIVLPTEKPFYLFPYGSTKCQKVSVFFSLDHVMGDNLVSSLALLSKIYHSFVKILYL